MKYPKLPENLNATRKLTNKQIDKIRLLYKGGSTTRELAQKFKVSKTTISYWIKTNEWRKQKNHKRYAQIKRQCENDPDFAKRHQKLKIKYYIDGYRKFEKRAIWKGKNTYKWKYKKYHTDPIFKEKTKLQAKNAYYKKRGIHLTDGTPCWCNPKIIKL